MSGGTTELARAKVNLTLHVGAAIQDEKWTGYHPVESLVVFADFGDELSFTSAKQSRVEYRGPCLLYTSPSPRDRQKSRMPSSA